MLLNRVELFHLKNICIDEIRKNHKSQLILAKFASMTSLKRQNHQIKADSKGPFTEILKFFEIPSESIDTGTYNKELNLRLPVLNVSVSGAGPG